MDNFILKLIALWISSADAERLHRSAPHLIHSAQEAAIHIAGAKVGLTIAKLPMNEWGVLMGLAWHESKFDFDKIFVEKNGKLSCGITTSIPVVTMHECEINIARGYVLSAEHLRDWLSMHSHLEPTRHLSRREAFQGIAGGWPLIKACLDGPVLNPWGVDKCEFQRTVDGTAAMIMGHSGS